MQLIDAKTVDQLSSFPELVDALERCHKEPPAELQDMLLSSPQNDGKPDDKLFIRAAWAHGSAFGLKAASVFPRNTIDSLLPSIHAQYILFDGKNGVPVAVIDGTALTYYKTAADSALGARYLARDDVSTMAMIGAGALAPYLIQAHCCVRKSIQSVVIWNRTARKAAQLAESLNIPSVDIKVSESIRETVRQSDLICSATMTTDPIISGEWLQAGAHLDLVGAFTLKMREADDDAIRKSKIFVDSRLTTIGEIGEIDIPLKAGLISEDEIIGDLFELCSGRAPGRTSPNDITLFKNGGGGHLDLMIAQHIVSAASA